MRFCKKMRAALKKMMGRQCVCVSLTLGASNVAPNCTPAKKKAILDRHDLERLRPWDGSQCFRSIEQCRELHLQARQDRKFPMCVKEIKMVSSSTTCTAALKKKDCRFLSLTLVASSSVQKTLKNMKLDPQCVSLNVEASSFATHCNASKRARHSD